MQKIRHINETKRFKRNDKRRKKRQTLIISYEKVNHITTNRRDKNLPSIKATKEVMCLSFVITNLPNRGDQKKDTKFPSRSKGRRSGFCSLFGRSTRMKRSEPEGIYMWKHKIGKVLC